MFQNNYKTPAMLVYRGNPVGVDIFFHVNGFFEVKTHLVDSFFRIRV